MPCSHRAMGLVWPLLLSDLAECPPLLGLGVPVRHQGRWKKRSQTLAGLNLLTWPRRPGTDFPAWRSRGLGMGLSPVDTPSRPLAANSILRPGKNLPGVRQLPMTLVVTASR